jgi:DNA-binding CsgD family transcriptional regulator
LAQTEKRITALLPTGSAGGQAMPDDSAIGSPSAARARAASEIGAAMAHELNGPMTALLLYIGYVQQNGDRFAGADSESRSFRQAVENACHEAEQLCSMIHRMGDFFEAPIRKQTAVAEARDAIAWWAKASDAGGKSPIDVSRRGAGDLGKPIAKPLTRREHEAMRLIAQGYSNKQSAVLMNISYRTLECHRARVMRKLGAKNTAELVRIVLQGANGPEPSSGPAEA